MQNDDLPCADASLLRGEPLAGTAAQASRWLFLEHRGPWGPEGVTDSDLPRPVVSHLKRLSAEAGVRVGLMRRPGREGPLSLLYADLSVDKTQLQSLEIADLAELEGVDWGALLAGDGPVLAGLRWMVCTHGRRDACCARLGAPVYQALEARVPGAVWQCSHLGGHRFAATLLVLPDGICYGRVSPAEAGAIAAAHQQGRIYSDLDRLRGRACWPPAAQVAEAAWRRETGERALDSVALVSISEVGATSAQPAHWRVVLRCGDEERTSTVEKVALGSAAPPSCGADPKPILTLRAS